MLYAIKGYILFVCTVIAVCLVGADQKVTPGKTQKPELKVMPKLVPNKPNIPPTSKKLVGSDNIKFANAGKLKIIPVQKPAKNTLLKSKQIVAENKKKSLVTKELIPPSNKVQKTLLRSENSEADKTQMLTKAEKEDPADFALSPSKLSLNPQGDVEPGFNLTQEEIEKLKLWPHGIIPYFIDDYSFDKVLRDRIRLILSEVNAATNVQFQELSRPPNDDTTRWVFFINRRGVLRCVDHPINDFTNQGVQRVILGYDCIDLNSGTAAIILALLGVPPQHNAPDRNVYIEVSKENVLPDKQHLFDEVPNNMWLFHDLDYDFTSASHYDYLKHSANGASTIKPKAHVTGSVGEDRTFSFLDIIKVRMLYNYIVKNVGEKRTKTCNQMFEPASGIKSYTTEKPKLVQVRRKPTKYLGDKKPEGNYLDIEYEDYSHEEEDEGDEGDDNHRMALNVAAVTEPSAIPTVDADNSIDEAEVGVNSYKLNDINHDIIIGNDGNDDLHDEIGTGDENTLKLSDKKSESKQKLKDIIQILSDYATEERK